MAIADQVGLNKGKKKCRKENIMTGGPNQGGIQPPAGRKNQNKQFGGKCGGRSV